MRYLLVFPVLLGAVFSFIPTPVYAVCPVCTVAVGAGLGLSHYFGIDDTVSGLWVGGLILSSSFWLIDWLSKKGVKMNGTLLSVIVIAGFYALTLVPLWQTKIIGHPFNTIFGVDKLLFGTAVGSLLFLLALLADKTVRKIRGKQFFVYQKVIFPVCTLLIMSFIFYYTVPKI